MIPRPPPPPPILMGYDELKTELQSIYEEKGKQGDFEHAKCRWVENGERPTKYFFNLEKCNYKKKTISELRLQDDSTTNNGNVILDQIETYSKISIHLTIPILTKNGILLSSI